MSDQTAIDVAGIERLAPAGRPLNGEEYLESLRDGREVYIYGERVDDVTAHPAFRNTARMLARLYDALHDGPDRDVLTVSTDTGNGGYTHRYFRAATTVEELQQQAMAIEAWARMTYGWAGRSPDYKAAFLQTLGSYTDYYAPFEENARRWYVAAQEQCLFFNHAIVNPPVDRNKGLDGVKDVYMHVEREVDGGLIVSGAKVVATGSALTHYNFIGHHGPLPVKTKEFSAVFCVPTGSPGLKLICRPSYEFTAACVGSPFDYPLSSRLDENDAIFVFDEVFVPWENVFCYDVEKANMFFIGSGFLHRALLHGGVRFAVKLDFLTGLLIRALETTGTAEFRGVQTRMGEVIAYRNAFWSFVHAMVDRPVRWADGTFVPDMDAAMAYRVLSTTLYSRVKEIFEQDLGSALIYLNSNAADWKNPDIRRYLDRYVRGSGEVDAEQRVKLMKLVWDTIGTEFGGRHELYERNYSGNHENIRLEAMFAQRQSGQLERYGELVDRCLDEYDLDGWKVPDLVPNRDFSVVRGNGATARAAERVD